MRRSTFNQLSILALVLGAVGARAAQAPAYRTSWLGNSFGGGQKWVQNFNEQMQVLPDGTAYLASFWDEAGREVGIYRNGDVVGKLANTHMRGGFAVAVGGGYAWYAHTCVREDQPAQKAGEARNDKPICYFGVSRYTPDGKPAPFPGGKTSSRNMLVLREAPDNHDLIPRGLSTDGRLLYVADTARDRIIVVDCAAMNVLKEFPAPRPTRVALSPGGTPWILSGGHFAAQDFDPAAPPARILRRDAAGEWKPAMPPLPDGAQPSSLSFAPDGRLLVTDQGRSQQLFIFDVKDRPRLVETIGEFGGMYAGPHPGTVGPLRFAGLTGAGFDAAGKLYVSCNVPKGGTVLRCFERAAAASPWRMKWELYNLEFVDVADADPATDGETAYTADGKYRENPDGSWRWEAQTLDPFRYPDDLRMRTSILQCGTEVRRLGGKPFLCMRGMWQGVLGLYRLDGEVAVPAVVLSSGPLKSEGGTWSAPGQPEKGRWLWRDANGDGRMQAGEYVPSEGPEGEYWASNVDSRGDIWQGGRSEGIWRWRFRGLDERGVPRYDAKPEHVSMPAPITDLLRTDYQPETDVMYLTGQTADRPISGGEWGTAGTVVCRYDNWSKPTRTLRYRTDLPYAAGKTSIASFTVAGDCFFAVEGKTAEVLAYDNRSGRLLASLKPGPEVHGESGWVDFRDGVRAFRRKSGEYLVFVEEDWKGKSIVYRWRPTPPSSAAAKDHHHA